MDEEKAGTGFGSNVTMDEGKEARIDSSAEVPSREGSRGVSSAVESNLIAGEVDLLGGETSDSGESEHVGSIAGDRPPSASAAKKAPPEKSGY